MTREPRRTCIACREVRGKDQLVRLVRRAEGAVVVDARGTAPGRGAYVCRGPGCADRLVKGGRASQAFRRPSKVAPEVAAAVHAMETSGMVRTDNDVTSSRR
jgi:predicted RNA-binding protein YlxR (DUF448 family)